MRERDRQSQREKRERGRPNPHLPLRTRKNLLNLKKLLMDFHNYKTKLLFVQVFWDYVCVCVCVCERVCVFFKYVSMSVFSIVALQKNQHLFLFVSPGNVLFAHQSTFDQCFFPPKKTLINDEIKICLFSIKCKPFMADYITTFKAFLCHIFGYLLRNLNKSFRQSTTV